jgi:GT2 family glycosyltransferase
VLLVEFFRYAKDRLTKPKVTLTKLVDLTTHHGATEAIGNPIGKVSIIIPTRDNVSLLKSCINSIFETTEYKNFEILVVNNDSSKTETLEYLLALQNQGIKVIDYPHKFNFSAICNFAASKATGEYLCFLNNDTTILLPNWLSSMVEHASEPTVGLVGAVLLYPDKTLQHMGISLGMFGGIAGHPSRGKSSEECLPEHCFKVSGVTFACAVISRAKFEGLGGLDEKFPVGFNDVDISIRASSAGLDNVLCTRSILTHTESQTRPRGNSLRGISTSLREVLAFLRKHPARHSDRFFQRRVSSKKLV